MCVCVCVLYTTGSVLYFKDSTARWGSMNEDPDKEFTFPFSINLCTPGKSFF